MQIASIVLPKVGNNGEDITAAHEFIMRKACELFGGFTAIDSVGGWLDERGILYQEEGKTYQIAMVDSPDNRFKLKSIAVFAGKRANQLAMFVTYPGGAAEILELSEKENANHA